MAGPEQTNVVNHQTKQTAKALGEFRKKHLASEGGEAGTSKGSDHSEVITSQAEATRNAVNAIRAGARSERTDGPATSPVAEAQAQATADMVRSIEQKKGK